jgi:hypothetical protein
MTQRTRQPWPGIIAGVLALAALFAVIGPPIARAHFQTITLTPEALPAGTVGVAYSVTITASGGEAPYTYVIEGTVPAELTLDSSTGVLSGTVSGAGTLTFTVVATDNNGISGSQEYQISFTESGAAPPPEEQPTPIPTADLNQLRREQLGAPRIEVDTSVGGLAIRSGPFVGATLENIAQPGFEYNIVGEYVPPGSRFTWYLIEYEVEVGRPPNSIIDLRTGWVSSRFVDVRGFILDIVPVANPFDGITTDNTGVSTVSRFKSNIYLYPAGSAPLVARFDEGSSMQVLGRTRIDQRDITYWIYVRLDRTGQVGWTRITPYFDVAGSLSAVPTY